jgi:hypothetical protein
MYFNEIMAVFVLMGLKVEHQISVIEDGMKQWSFCGYVGIAFVIMATLVWYAPIWEVFIYRKEYKKTDTNGVNTFCKWNTIG